MRRALFINAFVVGFAAMAAPAAQVTRPAAAQFSTDDQTTLNALCLRTRQILPRGARVPEDVRSRLTAAMPRLDAAEIDALTGNVSLCLARMAGGPFSAGHKGAFGNPRAGRPSGSVASNSTGNSDSESDLMSATQQMQETQMSFNLQYLQLQEQMQNNNRSDTVVSNIMKTKHDTVKNSLSNIR